MTDKTQEIWDCPDCGFSFLAIHEDVEGGHSCPNCGQHKAEAERDRLARSLTWALLRLETDRPAGSLGRWLASDGIKEACDALAAAGLPYHFAPMETDNAGE